MKSRAAYRIAAAEARTAGRTRLRLDRGRERLAAGDSVMDTCLAAGFTSLGRFGAPFARRCGVPPSAFRRDALAAQASGRVPAHVAPACMPLFTAACAASPQFSRSAAPGSAR